MASLAARGPRQSQPDPEARVRLARRLPEARPLRSPPDARGSGNPDRGSLAGLWPLTASGCLWQGWPSGRPQRRRGPPEAWERPARDSPEAARPARGWPEARQRPARGPPEARPEAHQRPARGSPLREACQRPAQARGQILARFWPSFGPILANCLSLGQIRLSLGQILAKFGQKRCTRRRRRRRTFST